MISSITATTRTISVSTVGKVGPQGPGLEDHAPTHTDGTDDIRDATNAQKGLATDAHIQAIEANTAASHTQNSDTMLDEGETNEVTASDLRTHLDDADKHREIDDTSTGTDDLWSADKIDGELAAKADKVGDATDNDIAGLDDDGDLKSLGPFSDLIQLGLPTWEAALSYDDGNYNEVEYAKGDIVYKQDITHTGSELTSVTYYKSTDGGSNWTEIGTETLNYTNGELTSTTWADA